MRIAVLGGDGFVGWPTVLHLSNLGHEVTIVDNLSRRWIDTELGVQSLTPDGFGAGAPAGLEAGVRSPDRLPADRHRQRVRTAQAGGSCGSRPTNVVIHLAQQRAAPYSMKSDRHKTYTVQNNTNATHNLLAALVAVDLDAHLVHMGTMGVYGYSTVGATIPEGYLPVQIGLEDGSSVEQEILYPASPGRASTMTKRPRSARCSSSTRRMTACASPTGTRPASSGTQFHGPDRPGANS
ncbi:MAG: NAD-dependent epimerase/dehydratase family protein [Gammaproteobacteria bacterium]|nr:NAD-dependent epimerase/dehydratase family protein [Gammaproteobacteria bacterium]